MMNRVVATILLVAAAFGGCGADQSEGKEDQPTAQVEQDGKADSTKPSSSTHWWLGGSRCRAPAIDCSFVVFNDGRPSKAVRTSDGVTHSIGW
jgi:hypothetical protein